jgi:hypothetical protein
MKGLIACAFVIGAVSLAAQAGQGRRGGQAGAGAPAAPAAPAGQAAMAKITSPADYSTVMKDVNTQNMALRRALTAATEADVAAAATKLEADFKQVQAYWEDKKVDDATTASKNAVTAAQSISKAVAAHDMAAATTASQTLGAQCMSCHMAHRNRLPDGTFEIK